MGYCNAIQILILAPLIFGAGLALNDGSWWYSNPVSYLIIFLFAANPISALVFVHTQYCPIFSVLLFIVCLIISSVCFAEHYGFQDETTTNQIQKGDEQMSLTQAVQETMKTGMLNVLYLLHFGFIPIWSIYSVEWDFALFCHLAPLAFRINLVQIAGLLLSNMHEHQETDPVLLFCFTLGVAAGFFSTLVIEIRVDTILWRAKKNTEKTASKLAA